MKLALSLLLVSQAQDVDHARVGVAIDKGCAWLMEQKDHDTVVHSYGRHQPAASQSTLELAVLTLAHGGVSENEPRFRALIDAMLQKKLPGTYSTCLQAMALEKINPTKYQKRLLACAQFLVDNQCENGQWDYGEPTDVPAFVEEPVVATGGSGKGGAASASGLSGPARGPLFSKYSVKKKKNGPASGDNSNSQYAALGIRACLDAGIHIDRDVLQRALKWWSEAQMDDGGWDYNDQNKHAPRASGTGTQAQPDSKGAAVKMDGNSYGSMTVGAVGAMCIYMHYLKLPYKNDPQMLRGLKWLAEHCSVKENPKKKDFYLYYLYGLERAGILYGTEKFGGHKWYPEGANVLLDAQKDDGHWTNGQTSHIKEDKKDVADTCFAILFLKRATAPLIYTGGPQRPGEKK